jgi:hypothetical protein
MDGSVTGEGEHAGEGVGVGKGAGTVSVGEGKPERTGTVDARDAREPQSTREGDEGAVRRKSGRAMELQAGRAGG